MTSVAGQQVRQGKTVAIGPLSDEDAARGHLYALLSRLLAAPADAATLDVCRQLNGDASPLGQALSALRRQATTADLTALDAEFFTIFIGVGRGELIPFASYYLTGFLQEKPLARLREDMVRLGLPHDASNREPEDSAGRILSMMAGLVGGAYGPWLQTVMAEQQRLAIETTFYKAHVGSWMPVLFRDIAAIGHSPFYAAVGAVGQAFVAIEDRMAEAQASGADHQSGAGTQIKRAGFH